MNEGKYVLRCSRNQLRVIQNALECYFRTHMGQFFDLASDIAYQDEEDHHEAANRRNEAQDYFDIAYRIATGGNIRNKTDDMQNAIDMWHVIRHLFWIENPNRSNDTTDSYPPFPIAGESLCEIEKIEPYGEKKK